MEYLTHTEIREPRELLIKYREQPIAPQRQRPEFKREKTTTATVRISGALHEAALKFAQERKDLSGGTFNGLVEFLLWQALGSDEKHLKSATQD
jgi:hypothetical protein